MSDSVTKPAEETVILDTDVLVGVSAAEVKSVVDKIAVGAIASFKVVYTITLHVTNTSTTHRMKLFRRYKIKRNLL